MTTKIFVAGHNGMVGSAICRLLSKQDDIQIIKKDRHELDLLNQNQVFDFLATEKPDQIYIAAAKVGGIHANNTYPADFIYQNLSIQNNLIHGAHLAGINKLLFLGSSCIYPKFAQQPITEDTLLTGALEPSNEPYAIAKIAGIKLCESYNRQYGCDYRSVMPTNLYGPGDNFHPENSHVIPAMLRRFHEAKANKLDAVTIWGSGKPMREFLHVDDMASACVFIMGLDKNMFNANISPMLSHINIGTGEDCTILELANTIKDVVGYQGKIILDKSKPDGTPRKLLDVSKLNKLGWHSQIDLINGLNQTYSWYKQNLNIRS